MTQHYEQDPLLSAIVNLDEKSALDIVRTRLEQGYDIFRLLKTCQDGIREVGRRYAEGEYFISGLVMGAWILQNTMEMISPGLELHYSEGHSGNIVIGSVKGDIHDVGKNIVKTLLCGQGFKVIDLGVDVQPEAFVQAVKEYHPQVLGLSCLVTTAFEGMKQTVAALEKAGIRQGLPIIIGGGQMDEMVCQEVGADYWTTEAVDGIAWCMRAAGNSRNKTLKKDDT